MALVATGISGIVIFSLVAVTLGYIGRSKADDTAAPGASASADTVSPSADPGASASPSALPSPSASPSKPAPTQSKPVLPPAYTQVCPPFPKFPGPDCTGWRHTGVKLRNCESPIHASNVTLDSCYFPDGIMVIGSNVTIKRSQSHGPVNAHWTNNFDFRNLTLIDVEIEEADNMHPDQSALSGPNFTCIRCDVHHMGSGIHVGDNSTVIDSWTHDFVMTPGAHGAGMGEGQGNGDHSKIIHNNIECNRLPGQQQICSSALSLYDEPTLDDVLVQNNLFNTVGGYCVYGGGADGTRIRFIDNRWGKKYHPRCGGYGPVAAFHPGNTGNVWSGNAWQDGSGPVTFNGQ